MRHLGMQMRHLGMHGGHLVFQQREADLHLNDMIDKHVDLALDAAYALQSEIGDVLNHGP